jgi:hypothetical protein
MKYLIAIIASILVLNCGGASDRDAMHEKVKNKFPNGKVYDLLDSDSNWKWIVVNGSELIYVVNGNVTDADITKIKILREYNESY